MCFFLSCSCVSLWRCILFRLFCFVLSFVSLFLFSSLLLFNSFLPSIGPMLCRGVPWFSSSPASAISMGHPFSTQISHAHSPSSVSSRHPVIRLWFSAWYDSFVYSPFLRAVTTISPLLSKSPRSCHATEAVSPPSYLIAHFSSSIATILPPCHLVTFLLFNQVIRSSVPCPRSSLMFAGTITSVSVPPPRFQSYTCPGF